MALVEVRKDHWSRNNVHRNRHCPVGGGGKMLLSKLNFPKKRRPSRGINHALQVYTRGLGSVVYIYTHAKLVVKKKYRQIVLITCLKRKHF